MNVKLLTKLRRKAHEEFGMAFFYDVFGRKVYSVGYRSRTEGRHGQRGIQAVLPRRVEADAVWEIREERRC